MKRTLYGLGAVLLTFMLLALSGCSETKAQKTEKIRIGLDSGTFSLQFRVADAKGYFKKYGIEPELSTFSFGIDTLNAALTNRVDAGMGMDYAVLTSVGKADLKVLSLINTPKEANQTLFARNGLSKPEDLKGKKLGVQKGTVNEYIWGKYFETFHIDKKDVTLVPLQSTAEILAAYERGDIDTAWFSGTFIEKAAKVNGSKPLNDLSAIKFRMRGYFVAQGALAKEKPELFVNLHKALDEASAFIKDHPEEAADIAAKALKVPKDAVLKEIKEQWDFDVRFSQEDFDHLQQIKAWTVSNGYLKETYELQDKISADAVKTALPKKVTLK